MRLYSHLLSGHCHKIRLLLGMLGTTYEEIPVDLAGGAHRQPEFLALNPVGTVPVLVDGETTLHDSHAILVYLARRYGGESWLPTDAEGLGRVMQWLSFSANEIHHGPNTARLYFLFKVPVDIDLAQKRSRAVLRLLDAHLKDRDWLELGRPTVADLACFPYVALAPEGRVPLDDYPNIRAWIDRVKALPGYVGMPGL